MKASNFWFEAFLFIFTKTNSMGFIRNIRKQVKEIRGAASLVPQDWQPSQETWTKDFALIWSIVKPSLELVKIVVPEKVDFVIDEIGVIADEIATSGTSERESVFIEKFAGIWHFVKFALTTAMIFTPDKVDKVLEQIVQWGDWLASQK